MMCFILEFPVYSKHRSEPLRSHEDILSQLDDANYKLQWTQSYPDAEPSTSHEDPQPSTSHDDPQPSTSHDDPQPSTSAGYAQVVRGSGENPALN